jgi:hypothetical protein
MSCKSCQGDSSQNVDNLNAGQFVRATGKPLLTSTVDLSNSLPPGQFAPVVRYYYLTAAQRKGLDGKPRTK